MIGVLANTATVFFGSAIGMLLKKGLPEKIKTAVMAALALCTIYIGVSGSLESKNTLVLVLSLAGGTLIGELLRLDDGINYLANRLQARFGGGGAESRLAEGFVTGSLLFCVGALTIMGSLDAGLYGDNTLLFTKSTMDFFSSMIFASALGIGVMLSAAFVLVFQGSIVILAGYIAPYISDEYTLCQMTAAGSVILIGLGLNILGLTNMKIMNMMPAIFLPILLCGFIAA